MKAIVVPEFGDPEVMREQEWADPRPGVGEVVVRVRAAGVNFADHLMRRGAYRGQQPPLIPGLELAGEVVMVGPDVEGLEVGQRVFGWGHDTYAELAAVPATKLLPIPEHLSFEEAAAVPVVFGTAWMCLGPLARTQPGEWVLVHAAGSGVGTAAIQIAKALGAYVVATAGADWKLERARELGAEATVNYTTTEDLAGEIERATDGHGVDVVLEGVGRATFAASTKAAAPMGRIVIYGAPSGARVELDTRHAIFKNLTIYGLAITNEPRAQTTADEFRGGGLALLQQRRISPVIHRVLPLGEAAEAHRIMLSRDLFGKLVLVP
jgi:NADPH2:quinone reductase